MMVPDSVTLREARPGEAAAIGVIHVASWRETYAGLLPDAMLVGLSAEARGEMWHAVLADPAASGDAAIFVAEADGKMVGFGTCGAQRDEALRAQGFGGEVGALYILRAHQRVGLGRALMRRLGERLIARGHEGAALWVLRGNPAREFYERLDGVVVGEKLSEDGDAGCDELAYGWRDVSAWLETIATPG